MRPARARMGNAAARQRRATPAPSSSSTSPTRRSPAGRGGRPRRDVPAPVHLGGKRHGGEARPSPPASGRDVRGARGASCGSVRTVIGRGRYTTGSAKPDEREPVREPESVAAARRRKGAGCTIEAATEQSTRCARARGLVDGGGRKCAGSAAPDPFPPTPPYRLRPGNPDRPRRRRGDPCTRSRTLFTADDLPVLRGIEPETVDVVRADPPLDSGRRRQAPIGSEAAGVAVGAAIGQGGVPTDAHAAASAHAGSSGHR